MAIFITGAFGYIGGTVAAKVIGTGREVRALVRTMHGPYNRAETDCETRAPLFGFRRSLQWLYSTRSSWSTTTWSNALAKPGRSTMSFM